MTISETKPSPGQVFRDPILLLAFGLGSGLSPRAPGTAGSVLGMALFPLVAVLPGAYYLLFVLLFSLFGVWVCARASQKLGVHDHGGIVIDEIAGIWLAMWVIPVSWPWMLAGFLLFRFFDIVKPWPISYLDRNVHGGVGIMVDDLLAGVLTWVILFASTLFLA